MTNTYHHGDLRKALIREAIYLIAENGIEKLSLRGVARRLEVSHTAPMRHFKSKNELLSTIALEGANALLEYLYSDEEIRGVDKVYKVVCNYLKWAVENPAYYQALRSNDVMMHASPAINEKLSSFYKIIISDVKVAQSLGWKENESPKKILLHLSALTIGSASMLTEPLYKGSVGMYFTLDDTTQVIRNFLYGN